MKRYWYFVATLPTFPFGGVPQISIDAFDKLCLRMMNPTDYDLLKYVDIVRNGHYDRAIEKSKFLKQYFLVEREIRNALAVSRAKAHQWDASPWMKNGISSPESNESAKAVLTAQNPLHAEMQLEKERWNMVDSLTACSNFELDYILAYKMKLLIATHCASFELRKGQEGLQSLYHDIVLDAADAARSA